MKPPEIISDPNQITPEWISDALRFAGIADGTLVGFEAQTVGTGQMGRNVRFTLQWREPLRGAPATVVCKFPSDDPKSRATGAAQGAYAKEILFYNTLKATVGIRTPACHFAAIAENGADFIMLMEDLAPAEQGDQLEGCDVEQAELALTELAKLHAPRWADPALLSIETLQRPDGNAGNLLQMIYKGLWAGFAERYGDKLSSEALALSERLGDGLPAWVLGAVGPQTLVHGDYRLDNMLFRTPAGGYPLAIVDWQTVGIGLGAGDAAYFLGASLLTEDRRKHEHELLRTYHEGLRSGGVEGYAFDDCWRDYRRGAFGGVVMSVVASMLVEQTERGDEMFLAMATRHTAHALDLEAEEFLS